MDPLTSYIAGQKGALEVQRQREAIPLQRQQGQLAVQQMEQQIDAGARQKTLQGAQVMDQFLRRVKEIPDPQQRLNLFQRAIPELKKFGIDLPPPEKITLESVSDTGLIPLETGIGRTLSELTAGEREFNALTRNLSPEDVEQARRVKLRIAAPAGSSAQERIAQDEMLSQQVAQSQKQIKTAEELGKGEAKLTSETITKSTDKIDKIGTNLINIDRAISALDRGGKTGAFEQRLLAIDEATRELRVLQNQFGLDLLGSVTLGAISEAELELALKTGLDLGQDEAALKDQLIQKREAQRKLIDYLDEQVQFLNDGGTVPEWRAYVKGKSQGSRSATPQAGGQGTQQQKIIEVDF